MCVWDLSLTVSGCGWKDVYIEKSCHGLPPAPQLGLIVHTLPRAAHGHCPTAHWPVPRHSTATGYLPDHTYTYARMQHAAPGRTAAAPPTPPTATHCPPCHPFTRAWVWTPWPCHGPHPHPHLPHPPTTHPPPHTPPPHALLVPACPLLHYWTFLDRRRCCAAFPILAYYLVAHQPPPTLVFPSRSVPFCLIIPVASAYHSSLSPLACAFAAFWFGRAARRSALPHAVVG